MKTMLLTFALLASVQQRDPEALLAEGRQYFENGQAEYNAAGRAQQNGDKDGYCDNLRAAYLDFDKAKNRFYSLTLAVAGQPSFRDAEKMVKMAYDARDQTKRAFEAGC